MEREAETLTLELPSPEWLGELEMHLQNRLNNRVRDLRPTLLDGGVVLTGRTSTYYAKQLAQHAVMEAVDIPIRANDIEVS